MTGGLVHHWDADLYDSRYGFVARLAADLVDLLDPRPGERVLDIGCGTGTLTAAIAARGATVVGLDASPAMIARARGGYPDITFEVADARDLDGPPRFDAVFSNATFHWIPEAGAVARAIAHVLVPGGRLVTEFGGERNLEGMIRAVAQARDELGLPANTGSWYFPAIGAYAALLESHGLRVAYASHVARPTRLEGGEDGMASWFAMFGSSLTCDLDAALERQVLKRAVALLRPTH